MMSHFQDGGHIINICPPPHAGGFTVIWATNHLSDNQLQATLFGQLGDTTLII